MFLRSEPKSLLLLSNLRNIAFCPSESVQSTGESKKRLGITSKITAKVKFS